ncbi:MAG: hypothetical protein KF866_12935 [Phycisphaeraceae bacterium]|nr:hypothetical protein [Phycisphaeraceae bacterium]MCW5754161.1 hypothetical protein [Phycisphaeraceae bacterium]
MPGCRRFVLSVGMVSLAMAAVTGLVMAIVAPWNTCFPLQMPAAWHTAAWDEPEHDPAEAQDPLVPDVAVTMRDGRRFVGQLVARSEREVAIESEGAVLRFQSRDVERVETLEPVSVVYARMREAIADNDSEQLLLLTEWLMNKRRYRSALREVEGVLSRDPGNPQAERLKLMLEAQIRLLESPEAPASRTSVRARRGYPLLTPAQINLIKVYELDLRRPGRLVVRRETIDRMIAQYAMHELIPASREGREALYRKPAAELVDLMFRLQARDLYGEVEVLDHPPSLRRFRDDVHREWLFRGCASNKCHGGEEAGRLWLATDQPNSDATIYTNFLVIERFRLPDGTPLINYDIPGESVLLQMALPAADSKRPHPAIREGSREIPWRGVLRGTHDDRYEKTLAWIRSMYKPRHEYPIEFDPPEPRGWTAGKP